MLGYNLVNHQAAIQTGLSLEFGELPLSARLLAEGFTLSISLRLHLENHPLIFERLLALLLLRIRALFFLFRREPDRFDVVSGFLKVLHKQCTDVDLALELRCHFRQIADRFHEQRERRQANGLGRQVIRLRHSLDGDIDLHFVIGHPHRGNAGLGIDLHTDYVPVAVRADNGRNALRTVKLGIVQVDVDRLAQLFEQHHFLRVDRTEHAKGAEQLLLHLPQRGSGLRVLPTEHIGGIHVRRPLRL